nr:hypothetical protein [uncultured Cetobacterium sp.]
MLRKILLGYAFVSTLVFSQINDYRNSISEEEKVKLNKVIEKFEESTSNRFFLNTLEEEEGFQTQEQEKVVIANLIKNGDNKLKIQVQVSQDLSPEDVSSEINVLLDSLDTSVKTDSEGVTAEKVVNGLQQIFVSSEELSENKNIFENDLWIKIIVGIVLTICVLWIRILHVKRKKRKFKLNRR